MDAAEGGVEFIVVITEGVPAHDEAWFYNKLKRDFPDVQLLGPNCPGIISPGKATSASPRATSPRRVARSAS